jgi:hypothetical protein
LITQFIALFMAFVTRRFLQNLQMFPVVNLILATKEGIDLLLKHGDTIFCDDAFELPEIGVSLTTLLVMVNGIAVPVVWLLSDVKTTANFRWFFKYICKLTEKQLKVSFFLCNGEGPLREAAEMVFKRASVLVHSSYFYQDNCQWMNNNGGAAYVGDLNDHLRFLRDSKTVEEFSENLNTFLTFWQAKHSPYEDYFIKRWMNGIPTSSWAAFERPARILAADHVVEGWRDRLKAIEFKDSVETTTSALYNEWEFWRPEERLQNKGRYQHPALRLL